MTPRHHLALLVALVLHSSDFHHWPLLTLLMLLLGWLSGLPIAISYSMIIGSSPLCNDKSLQDMDTQLPTVLGPMSRFVSAAAGEDGWRWWNERRKLLIGSLKILESDGKLDTHDTWEFRLKGLVICLVRNQFWFGEEDISQLLNSTTTLNYNATSIDNLFSKNVTWMFGDLLRKKTSPNVVLYKLPTCSLYLKITK